MKPKTFNQACRELGDAIVELRREMWEALETWPWWARVLVLAWMPTAVLVVQLLTGVDPWER